MAVSVIIPLYNRINLIEETLQSVVNQTYPNWEAVVVDDGSDDGSYEKVAAIAATEPRIRLMRRNRSPKGACTCRNIGLANAAAEYIVFLDSDDLLEPFCLQRRVAYFKENETEDFLVFNMHVCDKDTMQVVGIWNIDSQEDDLTRFFRMDALWQTTGPIYKKRALQDFGGFDETLTFWQDFDLHIRLILAGKKYRKFLDIAPDSLYRRQTGASISSGITFTASVEILNKRIAFYENILRLYGGTKLLTKTQHFAIWSMIGYFNRCFLYEHKRPALYKENYCRQQKQFRGQQFYPRINYLYDLMRYQSKKNTVREKAVFLFKRVFKSFLLDHGVLSRSTLFKPVFARR